MISLKEDHSDSIKNDKDFPLHHKDDVDSGLDNVSDSGDEEKSCNFDDFTSEESNSSNNESCLRKESSDEVGYGSEYIQLAEESTKEPIDLTTTIDDRPEWLDLEKFKLGQKFALDYYFGVSFAEVISLFLLFAIKPSPDTLIFTKKSDTPFKAFKRYLSAGNKMKLWYKGDVWGSDPNSPGRKSVENVRRMHKNVYLKLKDRTYDELKNEMTFEKDGVDSSKFPTKDKMQEDFKGCSHLQMEQNYKTNERVWFSQNELMFTQLSFVALPVLYPKSCGIYSASKEDFEGFIHFWRGIGYLMGITDKFNLCDGDLDQVRKRIEGMIQYVIIPSLKTVNVDWERMSRSVIDGMAYHMKGLNFEASLLYLCDALNLSVPKLRNSLTFMQYIRYLAMKFIFSFVVRIPGVMKFLSNHAQEKLSKVTKTSPETLAKWQAKKFSYID